jgi:Ca2+:H+ antiporter
VPALAALRREIALPACVGTAALVYGVFADTLDHPGSLVTLGLLSVWVIGAILWAAFSAVRHADAIAHALGEPLGTLVLTLAVTSIEVSIIGAVMFNGLPNESFARDTIFAVVMIVLNGLVGLSLLLGGLRHREQTYHLESGQAYLGVILPLAILALVLPNYTTATPDASLSSGQLLFLAAVSLLLYAVFLGIQTVRNRDYFEERLADLEHGVGGPLAGPLPARVLWGHAALLVAYLIPIVMLAEKLGHGIDFAIADLDAPQGLGGVLVASLVLAPEGVTALRAAKENRLQRSVNVLLGSVLASIGLTIPVMVAICLLTDRHLILGLNPANATLLVLTLASSVLTFLSGKTNMLQGAIHLVLFFGFVVLIFD